MGMVICCEWCGDEVTNADEFKQDPDDGTPYHRACWFEMLAEERA